MIIDAHQHFWQLDLPFDYGWLQAPENKKICRDFLPEDLAPLLEGAGIEKSIFVQTQHNVEENRWVLGLADQHDFLAGVVGWVDLSHPNVGQQVAEFQEYPKFVGVRHVTQDEPDDDFIIRDDVVRGLRVLERYRIPFDLLFYTQHLRHAETLGQLLPELPMVIDHLSKPEIRSGRIDSWRKDLQKAAEYPNIFCKISGMVTEADWGSWKISDLQPYVDVALECFGPERCMFGSDWPVCELAATYPEVVDAARQVISGLSPTEQSMILGGTAARFYGLDPR